MGRALDLARLLNSSGLVSLPSKVAGILPSANAPSNSALQVVNSTFGGYVTTTSSSWIDLGLSATITPKFATSKILILVDLAGTGAYGSNTACLGVKLLRGSTDILIIDGNVGYGIGTTGERDMGAAGSCSCLDSPATISATTYKIQMSNITASGTAMVGNYATGTIRPNCTMTLMEIAQ